MRQMAEGAKAINQTLAATNKRMTKMEDEVKESRMEAKVARDENQSNMWTLLHVTTTDSQITRKVSELNSNIALDNWNLGSYADKVYLAGNAVLDATTDQQRARAQRDVDHFTKAQEQLQSAVAAKQEQIRALEESSPMKSMRLSSTGSSC